MQNREPANLPTTRSSEFLASFLFSLAAARRFLRRINLSTKCMRFITLLQGFFRQDLRKAGDYGQRLATLSTGRVFRSLPSLKKSRCHLVSPPRLSSDVGNSQSRGVAPAICAGLTCRGLSGNRTACKIRDFGIPEMPSRSLFERADSRLPYRGSRKIISTEARSCTSSRVRVG